LIRIENKFAELREQSRKAFIAYITAGDPSVDATVNLIREFELQGVDIVELGVPFSDPVADGPVNQEAAMRALKNKVTISEILGGIRKIRDESEIPIIFFAYYNTILAYGMERFVDDAVKYGLDGALVLDLPPEEAGEYKQFMDTRNLATIFLISPVTPGDRIECIVNCSTGFIYYVSQMGVTGERENTAKDIPEMLRAIRMYTNIPVVVGFGISSPEQVHEIAGYADGVVVGSSIVRRIGKLGEKPGFETEVGKYVGKLTAPLKGV